MHADLIFVCHAATAAVRGASFPDDGPLDGRGRRDAAAARASLRRPDRAWRAPSVAAGETAAALGLLAEVDDAIRDCDFGRWTGRPLAVVSEEEPDDFAMWVTDPSAAPHGGESLVDLLGRVGAWTDDRRAISGRMMAVTHAAVVRAAVVHALGAGPITFWHVDVAPLCQVWLRSDGRRWTLRRLGPD